MFDAHSQSHCGRRNAIYPAFGKRTQTEKEDSMGKTIRALLGFSRLSDSDLVSRGRAVVKGLLNHAILSTPPYTIPVFEAALGAFATSIPAALDGRPAGIGEENKDRKGGEKMLKLLAAYVEVVAGD